jgi:dihydrofolate synthase/folylpolyglutamate synthase
VTYAEAIQFLYSLRWFGAKFGLEKTLRLAAPVGNPQNQLRFIHVAGTNGKGSTCAILESIYRAAGLRVGLFTSPHLVSFRERMQVNRQLISEADVVRLVEDLRRTGVAPVSDFGERGRIEDGDRQDTCPTFFEFVTVMALQYFAQQKCDLVIWETGLGGRLDATNIVTPLASVITNVQYDHQKWLGNTLAQIATEKAGIIKPGIPVITGAEEPQALAVIQETAIQRRSSLTLVTPAHTQHPPLDALRLPLLGWHQRMNAAVALATVGVLQTQLAVTENAIRAGLASVKWPGRLQLVERTLQSGTDFQPVSADGTKRSGFPETGKMPVPLQQRILLDAAHNSAGATTLRAALEEHFPGSRPAFILGIMSDKDWDLMCEILAPLAGRIVCVGVSSERSADPAQLRDACRRTNTDVQVTACPTLAEALAQTDAEPFVVIAGSIYLIGEAMERLHLATNPGTDEKPLNEWVARR